jgi:hypothetical protein
MRYSIVSFRVEALRQVDQEIRTFYGPDTPIRRLQLGRQPEQPVEENQVVSHEAGESASQANLPRKRAPTRCSGGG